MRCENMQGKKCPASEIQEDTADTHADTPSPHGKSCESSDMRWMERYTARAGQRQNCCARKHGKLHRGLSCKLPVRETRAAAGLDSDDNTQDLTDNAIGAALRLRSNSLPRQRHADSAHSAALP